MRSFEKSQPKLLHTFLGHHPFVFVGSKIKREPDILRLRIFKDELIFKFPCGPSLCFYRTSTVVVIQKVGLKFINNGACYFRKARVACYLWSSNKVMLSIFLSRVLLFVISLFFMIFYHVDVTRSPE